MARCRRAVWKTVAAHDLVQGPLQQVCFGLSRRCLLFREAVFTWELDIFPLSISIKPYWFEGRVVNESSNIMIYILTLYFYASMLPQRESLEMLLLMYFHRMRMKDNVGSEAYESSYIYHNI